MKYLLLTLVQVTVLSRTCYSGILISYLPQPCRPTERAEDTKDQLPSSPCIPSVSASSSSDAGSIPVFPWHSLVPFLTNSQPTEMPVLKQAVPGPREAASHGDLGKSVFYTRQANNKPFIRHGVKYIEMYLNTNTLEGFKYTYF